MNASSARTEPSAALGASRAVYAVSRAVYDLEVVRSAYAAVRRLPLVPDARNPTASARVGEHLRHARDRDRQRTAPTLKPAARCSRPAGAGRATWSPTTRPTTPASGAPRLDIGGTHPARRASLRLPAPRPVPERRPVAGSPCPPGVPDGAHAARIVAEDAAGNATFAQRPIRLDGTPPTAVLERARGTSIVISVTDAASGVAERDARGPEQLKRAVPDARRQGRERSAHRAGSTAAAPRASTCA